MPGLVFVGLREQVFVGRNARMLRENALKLHDALIRTLDFEPRDLDGLNNLAAPDLFKHNSGNDVGHGRDDARAFERLDIRL